MWCPGDAPRSDLSSEHLLHLGFQHEVDDVSELAS
jgi:hypothetical protein